MSINFNNHDITTSGNLTANSGNFTALTVNNSSFNSSVSGLLPTVSNSGDNRILTSTGSTVGINAESNLTFDGSLLTITGSGLFSSGVNISNQTASTIASFDSNKNLSSLSTASYPSLTELSYVKGLTSAIQTQIDTKAATATTITAGSGLAGGGSLAANRTIDIGQGDGMTISADSIAVDSTVIRTTGVQTMSGAKTFSAATVFSTGVTISSSGTNVPLTITNDGTGNSFVVNDVTGDTSPFVIDNAGKVGIGITSPSGILHVFNGVDAEEQVIIAESSGGFSNGAGISFRRSHVEMGRINADYFDGMTIFVTSGSNSAATEKIRITTDGNIDYKLNSGSVSHRFTYNENGGEIILYDDAQASATLIDQCSNSTRVLELINGSDMVIGLGGNNTTGAIKFMRAGFQEAMRITSAGNFGIGSSTNNTNIRARLQVCGPDADDDPSLGSGTGAFLITNSDSAYGMQFGVSSDGVGWIQQGRVDGTGTAYSLLINPVGGAIEVGAAGNTPIVASNSACFWGTNVTTLTGAANFHIITTNAQAADLGGCIGLGGSYSTTNSVSFATISGRKTNSTNNNSGGYLQFATRNQGGGTLVEAMRITDTGDVGIGTTSVSSGFKVDIRGRLLSYTTASDGLITTQGLQTVSGGTGKSAIQLDVNGKGGFAWQNDATTTRSLKLIENNGYGSGETTILTIQSGGNTGLGASPSNDYKLTIGGGTRTDSYTTNPSLLSIKDFTNTNTGDNLSSSTYAYATTNGSYAIRNVAVNTYFKINSGITNSGSSIGIANNNLRNYGLTNDIGTLSALYGIYNQYGHYNTSAVSPTTTTAIGIQHLLWRATGTITNAFDIYCSDASSGATVTNRWGIYVEHTGKNYFGGNTGVGVSPTYRFEVRGSGASSSTVSFYVSNSSAAAMFYIRDDGAINTGTAGVSPYNNTTGTAANMVVGSDGFLYRSSSSLRYKTNINNATHGLTEVLKLRSITFKGKNDGEKIFGGFIAEEVDEIGLTEFIQYDDENKPDSIHYSNMVALLTKAIQEQQVMINDLKNRLSLLEGN